MDIKTVSYMLRDIVLTLELSSQKHAVDRVTNPVQILAGVTGGLSKHSSQEED